MAQDDDGLVGTLTKYRDKMYAGLSKVREMNERGASKETGGQEAVRKYMAAADANRERQYAKGVTVKGGGGTAKRTPAKKRTIKRASGK